jgi:hypothetical protein
MVAMTAGDLGEKMDNCLEFQMVAMMETLEVVGLDKQRVACVADSWVRLWAASMVASKVLCSVA